MVPRAFEAYTEEKGSILQAMAWQTGACRDSFKKMVKVMGIHSGL